MFRISLLIHLTFGAGYAIGEMPRLNQPIEIENFIKTELYANFQSYDSTQELGDSATIPSTRFGSNSQSSPCYGEWMFPVGKSQNLNDYQAVFVGGLWDPREPLQKFVNQWGMPGFYIVPAKSKVGDLLRLGRIKLVGKSDPFARDLAKSMRDVNRKLTIYAISQGVLATVNAIKHHHMSNQHTFIFFSPALSYGAIRRNIPENKFEFIVPWFDASSVWAPSRNPFRILAGLTDLACGACMHWRKSIEYHFLLFHMRRQYPNDVVRYTTIRNENGKRERLITVTKKKPRR